MTLTSPEIVWDFGTAYELFISLHVLYEADYFGIRPSYAASVRARIPAEERKVLEEVFALVGVPLPWLARLPAPKDAISALWTIKQTPPAQRAIKMHSADCEVIAYDDPAATEKHKALNDMLLRVTAERKWGAPDADLLLKIHGKKHAGVKRENIEALLNWWSRPEELGEALFAALQSYYNAFFEEEEKRIEPALRAGLERAQTLASTMNFAELFNELSQGLHAGDEIRAKRFILAPAFWSTPLIFFEKIDADTMLLLFGARPADMSVIPGETVPDALVRSLKALADPTRLKILRYLTQESLTPSEIARKLQLRPPTVTHHLKELRLAGLVELSLLHEENRYTAREQAFDGVYQNLTNFLAGGQSK